MSNNYQAWKINPQDFYKQKTLEEKLIFFVRFGILAPSSHNTQPWRFHIHKNTILVYADFSRRLKQSDKTSRMLYIALGASVENIRVAADSWGFATTLTYNDALDGSAEWQDGGGGGELPKLVLQLDFQKTNERKYSDAIFEAIQQRASNRGGYTEQKADIEILNQLNEKPTRVDASIEIFLDKQQKKNLTRIMGDAIREIMRKRNFRWELARWARSNLTHKNDGMPGSGHNMPLLKSLVAPFVLRFIDVSKKEKEKALKRVPNFPAVGIITTRNDNAHAWEQAGELLQRALLAIEAGGMGAAIMAAIIESAEARDALQKMLPRDGGGASLPQIFFGFGFPRDKAPHSPRRDISEVVI